MSALPPGLDAEFCRATRVPLNEIDPARGIAFGLLGGTLVWELVAIIFLLTGWAP